MACVAMQHNQLCSTKFKLFPLKFYKCLNNFTFKFTALLTKNDERGLMEIPKEKASHMYMFREHGLTFALAFGLFQQR